MKIILLSLLAVNLITLILFGVDKFLAIKNKRRVAEKDLLVFSLLGGATGGLLGMIIFNHKISKKSFLWKIAVVFVLNIGFVIFLLK
jgi:uncharacterized membrane protein YsdA (DUF1294 family)